MRTTRTISISLPPAQLRTVERIARKENRTMSELVREALRQYERMLTPAPANLAEAVRLLREDARQKGADKLTARDINAEIAAVRRGRRRKASPPAT
jgi:Arc/MetJ-type ribon-helix-helix transcriptional regulator